jgi:hypothetical protein
MIGLRRIEIHVVYLKFHARTNCLIFGDHRPANYKAYVLHCYFADPAQEI